MLGRVLVVEDDPVTRLAIQTGLESEGYRVWVAANATDAQSILHYERVQAVVLDWMLGDAVDGMGLCRSIKSNPATHHLVVIMLTAKSSPQRRREARQAGVDVFLPKPFDLHSLLDALGQSLDVEPEAEDLPVVESAVAESVSGEWRPREYLIGSARLQMPDGRLTNRDTRAVAQLRRGESWILEVLARHAGVVPHEVLCRVVQHYRGGGQMRMGSLREVVRQINQKLRQVGLPEVRAQRGIGYRWLAHADGSASAEDPSDEWPAREYLVGPAKLEMPTARLVHRDTRTITQLRRGEGWILEALARHAGVVPHEELCRVVQRQRNGGQMQASALRETVRRLNQKLRQAALPEIHAQRGIGYRWLAHDLALPETDKDMTNP